MDVPVTNRRSAARAAPPALLPGLAVGSLLLLLLPLFASAEGLVRVSEAWSPATPPGARTAAVYLKLTNTGPDDRILAATADVAESVELHTHAEDNGMMRMRKLDSVPLPANAVVRFRPHGHHLMLIDLRDTPAPGDTIALTLRLESGVTLSFDAVVRDLRQ